MANLCRRNNDYLGNMGSFNRNPGKSRISCDTWIYNVGTNDDSMCADCVETDKIQVGILILNLFFMGL